MRQTCLYKLAWSSIVIVTGLKAAAVSARAILGIEGSSSLQIAAFKQCGGAAGCPPTTTCVDGPWSSATCPDGYTCFRYDQYYWQCRPVNDHPLGAAASALAPATPQQQQNPPALTAAAWTQCGGSLCPGLQDKSICGDYAWAACPTGLACIRRDQWYYQCRDTPFPGMAAAAGDTTVQAAAAAAVSALHTQPQQAMTLSTATAAAWTQCGGLKCADPTVCGDNAWATCPAGFTCIRRDPWYYQCRDKPFPGTAASGADPAAAAAAAAAAAIPQQQLLQAQAWAQCGGGTCPGIKDKSICGDKAWAGCPDGYTCYKRDPWYYQCRNSPFPGAAPVSAGMTTAVQQQGVQTQSTGLTASAWTQCGGATCPGITDKSICGDKPWATCPDGYKCYKRDPYYYQCRNSPFPGAAPDNGSAGMAAAVQQQGVQAPRTGLTASAWAQCGGATCPGIADKGICGDRAWAACPDGFTCYKRDPYYYQCRNLPFPGAAPNSGSAATTTASAWTQCGGATCPSIKDKSICGDKPWATCPDGYTCYKRDPWYYQCRNAPFPKSNHKSPPALHDLNQKGKSVGVVPTVTASTARLAANPKGYKMSNNVPDPIITEVPEGQLDVDVLQASGTVP